MGLLSAIGKIAGGAIGAVFGGPGGAAIGSKLGGALGGTVDGKKKGSKATTAEQPSYISQMPKITLEDIRGGSPSAYAILSKREESTKVAKSAAIPPVAFGAKDGELDDPWVPLGEWWADLGGDPGRLKPIDDTRF